MELSLSKFNKIPLFQLAVVEATRRRISTMIEYLVCHHSLHMSMMILFRLTSELPWCHLYSIWLWALWSVFKRLQNSCSILDPLLFSSRTNVILLLGSFYHPCSKFNVKFPTPSFRIKPSGGSGGLSAFLKRDEVLASLDPLPYSPLIDL